MPSIHPRRDANRWRHALQAAGIELAFLEALPPELRAEVLAAHGVSLPAAAPPPAVAPAPAPAPHAPAPPAASPPTPAEAPLEERQPEAGAAAAVPAAEPDQPAPVAPAEQPGMTFSDTVRLCCS